MIMESYKKHTRLQIATELMKTFASELMYNIEDGKEQKNEIIERFVDLSYEIADKIINKSGI